MTWTATLRQGRIIGFAAVLLRLAVAAPAELPMSAQHPFIDLWTWGKMPGAYSLARGKERDVTKATDKLIAGRPIIRLGDISSPQIQVFLPPKTR
jgi:hypothetical protein